MPYGRLHSSLEFAPVATAVAPDTCEHPAPVRGVMATEFSHYQGAQGPEGTRRTVTYYGPVVGGMPIEAWHCETCGLLKLDHPDGRHEERQLFPGPQPGLLQAPSESDLGVELGRQSRVSGLSLSPALASELAPPPLRPIIDISWLTNPLRNAGAAFYELNGLTQFAVVMFVATIAGLATAGVLAVYTYSTPSSISVVLWITVICFATAFAALIAPSVFPMPKLAPSLPDASRANAPMHPILKISVVSLTTATLLGLVAGVLAVYDYQTSPIEGWLVLGVGIAFTLGLFVALIAWLNGRAISRHHDMGVTAATFAWMGFLALWTAGVLDYVGIHIQVWFTTVDALTAYAGVALGVLAALLYSIATLPDTETH
jgi:MFS family permease